jgi:hypothetical protein
MNDELPLLRTRAQAANSERRAALDYRLAARLERARVRAYRSDSPEIVVDLALDGNLGESRGRPLANSQLFGTKFIRTVMTLRRELVAYQAKHGQSDNIVFIRIRPSLDPKSKMGALLDAAGHAPLKNLREVHSVTSDAIQGALEYMQSEKWLSRMNSANAATRILFPIEISWQT